MRCFGNSIRCTIQTETMTPSTGLRFHPVSILISSLIKLCLIFVIGPPAIAVLLSEVILNATSIFNHSNWRLNTRIDTVLRLFLVTPDVHRIHHSKSKDEQNYNFGFNFLWWDKNIRNLQGKTRVRTSIDAYWNSRL